MKRGTFTVARLVLGDCTIDGGPGGQGVRGEKIKRMVLGTLLILALFAAGGCRAAEVPAGAASVTFAVHCYDVGAAALEGRPGVLKVERGWRGWQEVDRVVFDPRRISKEQMERWLAEAGTYIGTVDEERKPSPREP